MAIRPEAGALVAALMCDPRCCFAITSTMMPKYLRAVVQTFLNNAAPEGGELTLTQATPPYWTSASSGAARVYVVHREEGAVYFECIWATLGACGRGQLAERNSVMLNCTTRCCE